MARRELHVIAPGEIEYRFHTIDDESESKTKDKENSKIPITRRNNSIAAFYMQQIIKYSKIILCQKFHASAYH